MKKTQKAYQNRLAGEGDAKVILADLRAFCYGTQSTIAKDLTGGTDTHEIARREGRREVFMRIMGFLKVDFDDYYEYMDFDDE